MRITTPMRVAIVCAFLVAALATMAVSQHGITHAAAPAKKSGKPTVRIMVNPSTVMLLTSGGFSTTVYGQGLSADSYYKLSDNNILCQDSINTNPPNVLTDLNGRFAYTLFANPISRPCLTGSFTVSAVGGKTKTVTAKVTLAYGQVLPTNVTVTPQLVVSLLDGSFATTVDITGLTPATTYYLLDSTTSCTTNYNASATSFKTDSEGNAELNLQGGPDYNSSSVPCHPGTYTETVTTDTVHVVVTTAWVLQPAQH